MGRGGGDGGGGGRKRPPLTEKSTKVSTKDERRLGTCLQNEVEVEVEVSPSTPIAIRFNSMIYYCFKLSIWRGTSACVTVLCLNAIL